MIIIQKKLLFNRQLINIDNTNDNNNNNNKIWTKTKPDPETAVLSYIYIYFLNDNIFCSEVLFIVQIAHFVWQTQISFHFYIQSKMSSLLEWKLFKI